MVVKKKRTVEEANLNQDSSPSSEELRELCRLVKSEVVIELAHLKQLKTLLKRMSKEEDGEKTVNSIVDTSVLTSLLSSFGALRTENDNKIYDILERLERKFKVNLGPLQPLVWGPQAKEHYQKLSSLGSSLHRISSNDVLSYLKPATTWNTVKNHSRPEQFDTYNTRFIMQLFAYLLQPGSEVSCPKFIKENCLSLVFSCLSSKNEATRVLAYYNLQRFLSLLLELKEERFNEKALFIYVVRLFKQSLPTSAPRISHLVSHFFARVSKLILHPEDPVYGQIVAFLCQKPQIDLRNVPEFYKLLLSTSVEYYKQEREWILVLIAEAIIDPFDYAVLQNRSGVKLLLSLFNSCVLDQPCRKSILGILKASAKIPSAAYDLVHRCNIHAWIALTIKNAKLTRWERNYLAQIFLILLKNEKTIREQKTDRDASTAVGTMTKLASKTVVSVMRELLATESEVVSNQRLEEIEAFFQE